jgi:FtsP/CotA-like multicopper oxidase with cupredoxin domain
MFIVLVAAAALTLSGCDGGGGSSSSAPPATQTTQPPVTATDADGDGVLDTNDAFPNDPAASVDTDGDGFPDSMNAGATEQQITDTTLILDRWPNCAAAAVDTDGDGQPDGAHPSTGTPEELAACGNLVADADDDNDAVANVDDAAPQLGITDIPTESPFGASPLFQAGEFDQQMIRFEEFGPELMPTSAVAEANWVPLPQPQNAQNGPLPAALSAFLAQDGVWPYPQRLSNVDVESPWKSYVEAYLGRALVSPGVGVAGPAEGRPSGEDWAHQRWDELYPRKYYKTTVAQSRVNLGLRDAKQRHGYAKGEFGPGGLYNRVFTYEDVALDATTAGIAIKFHPNMPVQAPNSIWTFDGTLPPKLLQARYGEPILMRNYNSLPMDPTANNGFGRHTITTHEHNGHQPGESDGFAGAYFYPGQFYDYRWPMQLAGYSNRNNAAGAINYEASDPKAAIPCDPNDPNDQTFTVLVNGQPVERTCQDGRVMIPGDWRETMSTHWFHDHMIDHTAENVYKGNATMMNYYSALDRANEAIDDGVNLRFPSGTALSWGNRDYDINLVIADKAFNADGQLWFNTAQRNGFLGDVMTVNFLYKPYFDVRARKYRFRILNGSVSRIMAIGLVAERNDELGELPGPAGSGKSYDRAPFHMIGNDGNILEHAVAFDGTHDYGWGLTAAEWKGQLPSQTIAERYDIIVDFSQFAPGTKLYFVNTMEHEDGKGTKSKVPVADIVSGKYQAVVSNGKWINGDPGVGKFMEVRVHEYTGTDLSMNPAEYVAGGKKMIPLTIDRAAGTVNGKPLSEARHHTFEFVRSNAQGGHGTPWAIKVDGGTDERADVGRISAVQNGDLEVWRIKTGGGWTHPVHIHFEEGIILTRGGKAPPEWEKWARKDMYRIGPEGDSKLEVEIAFRARDFLGHYVQHCHNTMHEDHAMLMRWDARENRVDLIDTPMPTYDGVFFEPSFVTDGGLEGDGVGPETALP